MEFLAKLPFSAVFFDMDGTLVNTEPYWLEAERSLMSDFGKDWTLEDQAYCLGGPLSNMGKYMWEKAGKESSPEYFGTECVTRVAALFKQGVPYMPGAYELLNIFFDAGIPLALVSASPRILIESTVAMLDKQYFQTTIGSEDVTMTKPNPEGYLLAAQRLGVAISDSLIFEDSHTGIKAAQDSGASVIAIPHLNPIEESGRTRVVSTLMNMTLDDVSQLFVPINETTVL
ncbi:MAG: hypothetical protein RL414_434 [Actinomycetota bacterium]